MHYYKTLIRAFHGDTLPCGRPRMIPVSRGRFVCWEGES